MAMDVLWMGEPACARVELVGGKTANLSRLAAAHRVPPGFCLPTQAFLEATVAGAAHGLFALPERWRRAIAMAYAALARRAGVDPVRVAVRSSAADEDGGEHSFAGQHETLLNVHGVEAVIEAVRRCWASAWSARAAGYRAQRGLAAEQPRLAVLVQQLVPADVSAVAFSVNPLTSNREEVVINASWGLGESLVGGTVTPDTYVVAKDGGAVRTRQIAEKQRMTVSVPGGTSEVDTPRLLRRQPCLTDAQAAEIAQLVCSLEQTMGWPVDVECAFDGDALYLLQCRPITTLRLGGSA